MILGQYFTGIIANIIYNHPMFHIIFTDSYPRLPTVPVPRNPNGTRPESATTSISGSSTVNLKKTSPKSWVASKMNVWYISIPTWSYIYGLMNGQTIHNQPNHPQSNHLFPAPDYELELLQWSSQSSADCDTLSVAPWRFATLPRAPGCGWEDETVRGLDFRQGGPLCSL